MGSFSLSLSPIIVISQTVRMRFGAPGKKMGMKKVAHISRFTIRQGRGSPIYCRGSAGLKRKEGAKNSSWLESVAIFFQKDPFIYHTPRLGGKSGQNYLNLYNYFCLTRSAAAWLSVKCLIWKLSIVSNSFDCDKSTLTVEIRD